MMETDSKSLSKTAGWTYAEIIVHDGDRILNPTHICSDEMTFRDPPQLLHAEISICIKNGDRQTTHTAHILPHASGSTRIPIQLAVHTKKKSRPS